MQEPWSGTTILRPSNGRPERGFGNHTDERLGQNAEESTEKLLAGDPVVEVSAVPDPESVSKLLAGLRESLPRFCEEGEKLGKSFARGEWRATLERLMTYLEELRVVLSGFQAVQRLTQSGAFPGVSSVREILSNLSSPIQRQSWVEVSDLLLYELVPLIDEWQRDSSWDEE